MTFLWVVILIQAYTIRAQGQLTTSSPVECIEGPSTSYRGTRSTTATGKICQRWDVDTPHKPRHFPKDGTHHNYCRNPDNDLGGTWCYTIEDSTRWEYCNISKCPDDSLLIWTSYDSSSESTQLLQLEADPEIAKRKTITLGDLGIVVLTESNHSMAEFRALAADYRRSKLYYSDYKSRYIGVWHVKKKTAEKHFEGLVHRIESIAHDWKTNNLYWTDSGSRMIMVADNHFQYYAPVYRTSPDQPYGLAVHSVKRLLIFSTYKAFGSKIITTDLAGQSPKVIISFPQVIDVTGITIDFKDDRIYWTDFTGYGGVVMSSRLDGTDKRMIRYRKTSIFWGVAIYMDYIYVSDVFGHYAVGSSSPIYSIRILHQRNTRALRYKLEGKPRGVAVYSRNEHIPYDFDSGECSKTPKCDHICLLRMNATRTCVCSIGYQYEEVTGRCRPKLVPDDATGELRISNGPANASSDRSFNRFHF